jgi:hypothetical protein
MGSGDGLIKLIACISVWTINEYGKLFIWFRFLVCVNLILCAKYHFVIWAFNKRKLQLLLLLFIRKIYIIFTFFTHCHRLKWILLHWSCHAHTLVVSEIVNNRWMSMVVSTKLLIAVLIININRKVLYKFVHH